MGRCLRWVPVPLRSGHAYTILVLSILSCAPLVEFSFFPCNVHFTGNEATQVRASVAQHDLLP